jgi:hypothetical protein
MVLKNCTRGRRGGLGNRGQVGLRRLGREIVVGERAFGLARARIGTLLVC